MQIKPFNIKLSTRGHHSSLAITHLNTEKECTRLARVEPDAAGGKSERDSPEYEDEEDEEGEEGGDVVHGLEHDEQLVAQGRHEAHQLEDTQQAECAENRQAPSATLQDLHSTKT